jgi:hypothetical protein
VTLSERYVLDVGPEEERLREALLRRAREAVDTAAETVAHSLVLTTVATDIREGGMTRRCAWCGRYLIGDQWVTVADSLFVERTRTSHSICDDCVASLREDGLSV